jgi:uncharacterized repeat protein (TIGR01451 family)
VVSQKKVALLTAAMMVPLVLIVLSMTLALAQEGELDVGVFKFDDPDPVVAGGDLTYTILVTNSQGVTATNVMVTDTLDTDVAYVSGPGFCAENSPGVLSCTPSGGDLDPGEEISFTIDVQVSPYAYDPGDPEPELTNTVEVTATAGVTPDVNLANNIAVETTDIWGEEADLTIWKETFPGDVVPIGEWFSYTLWVENLGPSVASQVVVMDWFATDGSLNVVWDEDQYYPEYHACGPMPTDQGWAETPAWLLNWYSGICTAAPWLDICFDGGFPWWEPWQWYWENNFPPNYPYPLAVDWMCIWYPWEFEFLEPGEQISMTIDVLPLDAQTIYDQAWVLPDMYPLEWFEDGWGTPDPDPYNNVDELITEVTNEADLKVVKVSKPDINVDAGQPFTYTLFVENLGPAPAHQVSIRDEILSSGSFYTREIILDPNRANDGPFYTESPEGGLTMEFHLEEPLEPKGADNQGRWVIQIVLQADETQDVNNLVQVFTREGGSFDPDLSNNQDEDSIYVGDVADLWADKYLVDGPFGEPLEPFPLTAGGEYWFALHVHNNGPSTAENVVLEDVLPAEVTVIEVVPGGPGSCTTGIPGDPLAPLVCNAGNLLPDEGSQFFVLLRIDPDYVDPVLPNDYRELENDLVVYSDHFDPNNEDNRAHMILPVYTYSDVFMWKTGPEEAVAGEEMSYHIRVRNLGPSTLHNFHFVDELPGEVTYLGYEIEQGTGTCIYPWPYAGELGEIPVAHCYLDDIPPGGVRVVHLRVLVDPHVPDGTWIYNGIVGWFADSGHDVFGPHWWETEIMNEADLSIWKEADPWKVYAGEQIRYDIEVTNNGPGVAWDVLVSDTLPISVTYELATIEDCYPLDGQVECYFEGIAPGETRTFSIFARVEPGADPGPVSNEAIVSSETTFDPIEYNDRDTAPSYVQGKADLKITKFGKPDGEVRADEQLIYTLVVDNLGPGYGHDVVVRDILESNGEFDLVSVTSDRDADCDPTSGTYTNTLELTCSLTGTLEVMTSGESGRWIVTVVVEAAEPQSINNVAHVVSADFDPDPSNNQAIAEHDITAVADLELTKVAWGEVLVGCEGETELWMDEIAAGGTVSYTLTVTNTGPSTAENVVLRDQPLPSLLEIDLQSITPSQGNCLTANIGEPDYLLTCNLGTVAPEGMATVTFVAHVPSWVPDGTPLVNDALVYSDMFDDDTGNSIVSNHTIVSAWADLEVEKTQEPEATLPGLEVTYTITATNLGPSDAHGVIVSDTMPFTPTNITVECCASDGGDCNVECEVPTCPAGECPWPEVDFIAEADIPAGEWVIYTVTATPELVLCEMITNTVEVIAPQSVVYEDDIDPCDENNVAYTESDPLCHFVPLVLKEYPPSDTTP